MNYLHQLGYFGPFSFGMRPAPGRNVHSTHLRSWRFRHSFLNQNAKKISHVIAATWSKLRIPYDSSSKLLEQCRSTVGNVAKWIFIAELLQIQKHSRRVWKRDLINGAANPGIKDATTVIGDQIAPDPLDYQIHLQFIVGLLFVFDEFAARKAASAYEYGRDIVTLWGACIGDSKKRYCHSEDGAFHGHSLVRVITARSSRGVQTEVTV